MFCKNCGKEIKEDDVFCENCGAKVSKPLKTNDKNITKGRKINAWSIFIGIILIIFIGFVLFFVQKIINEKLKSNTNKNVELESINKSSNSTNNKSENNLEVFESKSYDKKDILIEGNESVDKQENLIDQSILNERIKSEVANLDNSTSANYTVAFMDLKSKDYMSYNSRKVNSASVIKIFIMIEAYRQIEAGVLNENEDIVLRDYMKVGGSGILAREEDGTSQKIENLIDLMMTQSDNTAANMLIDKLGMDNINKTIGVLGMNDTVLSRKMMDQNAINNGIQNYTSVNDLCKVLKMLYNGECINKEYDSKMLDIMKRHQNSTKIPNSLPNTVLVSHKSGEFTGVENDAGIVFTDKGDYILCILSDNGNSGEQISNINKISKMVYDEFLKTK